jgi:glycosyltransferase involved in cell wall biosynthesis
MIPAVSVVVATYNYGRFLAGALDSALNQSQRDLEVIVIDDGSTDNTAEVIQSYLSDTRLRYERTSHVGQPAAKNHGIRLARAPLVAFLDADDLWLPSKLERQAALFQADPDLGVAFTRRLLIDEQGRLLEFRQPALPRGRLAEALVRDNFICFSSAMVRRDVFADIGLFDEGLAVAIDYDLWLRTSIHYSFDYVDEPLVKYRTGHANLSRRLEERLAAADLILDRFLNEYGGWGAVSASVVRRSRANTSYYLALSRERASRVAAFACLLRCLSLSPGHLPAWKRLATLLLPHSWCRSMRVALGRPADWFLRHPAPQEQASPAIEPHPAR